MKNSLQISPKQPLPKRSVFAPRKQLCNDFWSFVTKKPKFHVIFDPVNQKLAKFTIRYPFLNDECRFSPLKRVMANVVFSTFSRFSGAPRNHPFLPHFARPPKKQEKSENLSLFSYHPH